MAATRIKIRRDTAANWTATNPRLHNGERGLESDTRKTKMGDGVLFWNDLPYEFNMASIAQPNTQVVHGTGTGISSSPNHTIVTVAAASTLTVGAVNTHAGRLVLHQVGIALPWFEASDVNGLMIRDVYGLGIAGNQITAKIYNNFDAALFLATVNSQVALITKQGIAIGHISSGTFMDADAVSGVVEHLGDTNLSIRNAIDIPTTSYVDGVLLFAKDRSGAGTSSPYFRCENGTEIDIAGLSAGFTNPMTTLGDSIYGGAAGVATRLAGNTSATKKFISQTGNGTISAAPTWEVVTKTDVGLSNVENVAVSTWGGSASIVTVGVIGAGTWEGNIIQPAFGGTGIQNGINTITVNTNPAVFDFTGAFTLQVKGNAEIEGNNTGDQTITLTGDVTGTGEGSFAATIANNAVTRAKMADIATRSVLGRNTAGTGDPEELTDFAIGVLSHAAGNGNTVTASSTLYGQFFFASSLSVESARQNVMPFACTIKNLYVRTSTAQSGTGNMVITIRKNGAATALTLTIAAGAAAGTFTDLVNSFTVVAGDLLSIELVNNATATSANEREITCGMYF